MRFKLVRGVFICHTCIRPTCVGWATKRGRGNIFLIAFLFLGGFASHLISTTAYAATTYIYSTFTDDTGAGMKLKLYTSTDAVNFSLLYNTAFPTGYLRDPSIMKWTDGKYYVAYTNPQKASCCGPEDHFSIASSPDLKTWAHVADVPAGVTGAVHVWAPEWYIEGGVARIIANIDTLNNDTDFKPYIFTAKNSALTSWSGAVDMNIGINHIDTVMVKSGSTYHVFTKDEKPRYIVHATSSSVTGPWKWVGTGNWAGWGSGLEGPTIVKLEDGTWRMYLDPQAGGVAYKYTDSQDLNVWTALKTLPNAGSVFRHGTALRDASYGLGINLAAGKMATADSSQSVNPAANGNDGNATNRWCASDGSINHWWTVDLGAAYALTGSEVMWEFARNYQYKVEVSTDNANWVLKANNTATTSIGQTRADNFTATARYVRITVTGLPASPSTWASFFEFRVFGI